MSTPALLLPSGHVRPPAHSLSLTAVAEILRDDITSPPPEERQKLSVVSNDSEPTRHTADRRLWRARRGEPGVYRAYPSEGEKIIFRVWSVLHHETGERITRVYLVTHWQDGELVKRFRRDEPQPYLPLRVLSGRFKLTTIPEEHRAELAPIARLFTQAARHYDKECKEWRERSR